MIKNLIIIAIIIGAVVISQQPAVKGWGQNTLSWIEKKTDPYTSKITDLFEKKLYPTIGGEVEKRKDIIEQEIAEEKEKISETLAEKIKKYFSNIIDLIFFPNRTNQSSSLLDSLNSQNPNLSPELQKCIEGCQLPKTQ
jgi:hypothetical protein